MLPAAVAPGPVAGWRARRIEKKEDLRPCFIRRAAVCVPVRGN